MIAISDTAKVITDCHLEHCENIWINSDQIWRLNGIQSEPWSRILRKQCIPDRIAGSHWTWRPPLHSPWYITLPKLLCGDHTVPYRSTPFHITPNPTIAGHTSLMVLPESYHANLFAQVVWSKVQFDAGGWITMRRGIAWASVVSSTIPDLFLRAGSSDTLANWWEDARLANGDLQNSAQIFDISK